jgi:hypothetical protein
MRDKSIPGYREWFKHTKPFWALSRTPHLLLDMATPVLGAILVLGGLPSAGVMLLGMVTAFAGYTAVYALNDVIDYRTDTEKMSASGHKNSEAYLDGVMIRHPLATGIISVSQGVLWVGLWSMLALAGAYRLNPVCMWIFLGGIGLEIIYCLPDPMTTRAFNDDALPFKHIFSNGFHLHPVRSHIHSRHTQVDNRRGLRRPAVPESVTVKTRSLMARTGFGVTSRRMSILPIRSVQASSCKSQLINFRYPLSAWVIRDEHPMINPMRGKSKNIRTGKWMNRRIRIIRSPQQQLFACKYRSSESVSTY